MNTSEMLKAVNALLKIVGAINTDDGPKELEDQVYALDCGLDDLRTALEEMEPVDTVSEFRQAWHEAMTGQTVSLDEVLKELDEDK